jgi:hypothetical protein
MIATSTSSHPGIDRRTAPRFVFDENAMVVGEHGTAEALTKDIGTGGICLVFGGASPVSVGERVEVRFQLPKLSGPTCVAAIVRWVGGPDGVMAGLQFARGLRAREAWAISALGAARG